MATPDLQIEFVIRGASWCPNPESDREMQLEYQLIRQGNQLIIATHRKRKLIAIGALPPGVYNRVYRLHAAGAEIDLDTLDSSPKNRAVHFSLWIAGDEIDELGDRVKEIRRAEQDARAAREAAAQAERDRKSQAWKRRRARVIGSLSSLITKLRR